MHLLLNLSKPRDQVTVLKIEMLSFTGAVNVLLQMRYYYAYFLLISPLKSQCDRSTITISLTETIKQYACRG